MKLKSFVYKNKKYKSISKTELCRALGLLPNTKNLKEIISTTEVKPRNKDSKSYKYNMKSPYKAVGLTVNEVMGKKKRRVMTTNSDLPSRKEIDSFLGIDFPSDDYSPY